MCFNVIIGSKNSNNAINDINVRNHPIGASNILENLVRNANPMQLFVFNTIGRM